MVPSNCGAEAWYKCLFGPHSLFRYTWKRQYHQLLPRSVKVNDEFLRNKTSLSKDQSVTILVAIGSYLVTL